MKSCSNGCNNPATVVPNGSQDNEGGLKCNATIGCPVPPCQCDGSGVCVNQSGCGDGSCAATENCPVDSVSCVEPAVCYLKSCTNGCNNPATAVANGSQDNEGATKCNATIGCGSLPCKCNGSGQCVHAGSCGAGHTDNGDGTCTATFSIATKIGTVGKSSSGGYLSQGNTLWFFLGDPSPPVYTYRAYAEWNISSIPAGSTINQTLFKYHGSLHVNTGMIKELKTVRPSGGGFAGTLYAAIGSELLYANPASFPIVGPNQSIDLGNAAKTTLQNTQLPLGWFAIGFQSSDETVNADGPVIAVSWATPKPTLEVNYVPPS